MTDIHHLLSNPQNSQVGSAVSLGEQPIKCLVCPAAGARMSVGEAITNIMFAPVTCIQDIKCSGNWMWPAKIPGEGAKLTDACLAMCQVMKELQIAVDGGKDSLGMAANVPGIGMVKSPGTLVISAYAPCVDVMKVVNPECAIPDGQGCLIYVRANGENAKSVCELNRLSATALAQCQNQLGNQCTDLYAPKILMQVFSVVQQLVKDGQISAGHDVSDGGLITTLLEMAFATNCGIDIKLPVADKDVISYLFAEDLGIVIECSQKNCDSVIASLPEGTAVCIGYTKSVFGPSAEVHISTTDNESLLKMPLNKLRHMWEETSFELEKCQADVKCVSEEAEFLQTCTTLPWEVNFDYTTPIKLPMEIEYAPNVAILREEGSNGDREMAAAFHTAGFQVFDVCMQDLLSPSNSNSTLNSFRGLAFVGGFSYADVLGSAKGWAAALKMGKMGALGAQLEVFRQRVDTFSLGVCNGCQLMALLGWVGSCGEDAPAPTQSVLLEENDVGRFVSCFNTVKIEQSNSVMFRQMSGSVLQVWTSHGEGKFNFFRGDAQISSLRKNRCLPLTYIDPTTMKAASKYPANPNGSPGAAPRHCKMPCKV